MSFNFDELLKDFGATGVGGGMSVHDKLRITEKALNHYKDRAKVAEDALLGLTCSGSEFFLRHGEGYRVDVTACLVYIRKTRNYHFDLIRKLIREAKRMQHLYG